MRKIILGVTAAAALAGVASASGYGHGHNPYNFNYGYVGGFRDATPVDSYYYAPAYRPRVIVVVPTYRYRAYRY